MNSSVVPAIAILKLPHGFRVPTVVYDKQDIPHGLLTLRTVVPQTSGHTILHIRLLSECKKRLQKIRPQGLTVRLGVLPGVLFPADYNFVQLAHRTFCNSDCKYSFQNLLQRNRQGRRDELSEV